MQHKTMPQIQATPCKLEKAAHEAAERIRAAGFAAKANNVEGSISLQVQVEPGDKRIAWNDITVHTSPHCTQITDSRVAMRTPSGFSYNSLNGMYYLSYGVRKVADALVFAHIMCGTAPIRGPRSMNEAALHELERRLGA